MKKITIMLLAFCVTFSFMPMASSEVYAASKKISVSATGATQTTTTLKWNKISGAKGYTAFVDGTPVYHFGKNTTACTCSGLRAGSTHKFQIKSHVASKKPQYYNKKTKKWQNKKPAKKYRGGTRKVTTYSYKKKSNVVSATNTKYKSSVTLANGSVKVGAISQMPYSTSTGARPSFSSSNTNIATVDASGTVKGVSKGTCYIYASLSETSTHYGSSASASISVTENLENNGNTKTVTDYLGVTRTFTKTTTSLGGSSITVWKCGSIQIAASASANTWAKYDRNVDGNFTANNNHSMVQYHGATFDMTELNAMEPNLDMATYSVKMYNGDESKFKIEPDSSITIISRDTYVQVGKNQYNSVKKYYLTKNGYPIALTAEVYNNKFVFKTTKDGVITTKQFGFITAPRSVGDALGIYTDDFNVNISYDGKNLRSIKFDTTADPYTQNGGASWTKNTCGGMSPYRKIAEDIARAAMTEYSKTPEGNGRIHTDSVEGDFAVISAYIKKNYRYDEPVSGYGAALNMNCTGGVLVLETWSIKEWGCFGFRSSGSNYDGTNNNGVHNAFNLDSYPFRYYETNGHQ